MLLNIGPQRDVFQNKSYVGKRKIGTEHRPKSTRVRLVLLDNIRYLVLEP